MDFTATVTPDPGPGTIEWLVDDVVAASGPLEPGGLSHFSTSFSTPYGHSVKARFGGNDAYQASTGNRNVHLAPLPSAVTISMPPSPIPAGPVTATVTVSPNPGAGTLTWRTTYLGGATTPVDPDGTTDILLATSAHGGHAVRELRRLRAIRAVVRGARVPGRQRAGGTIATQSLHGLGRRDPVMLTATVGRSPGAHGDVPR